MIAGRDSKGHFIKGNVPWNKRLDSSPSRIKSSRTSLVVRRVTNGGVPKLRLVRAGPKVITEGILKLERIQVICPACGQQVEAVASDGRVKGYCAVAKQYVDFLIETQRLAEHLTVEHRAKISGPHAGKHLSAEHRATLSATTKKVWQDPEYRAKQIASHTGKHLSAEDRAKLSAARKKIWQDPEYRAKQTASVLKRQHNTERGV